MRWFDEILRHRDSDATFVEVLGGGTYSYRHLFDAAAGLSDRLVPDGGRPRRAGLVAHNSPEWVAADLACLFAGAVEVAVPLAFSRDQARSLLAEVDVCLVDGPGAERLAAWGDGVLPDGVEVVRCDLAELAAAGKGRTVAAPDGDRVCKITHTSGTTSAPKGARIRSAGLDAVLTSLEARIPPATGRRYLSMVPLSLLIEQITAIYLTALGGGELALLPPGVPLLGTAADALPAILHSMPAARVTALQGPPAVFEAFARIAAARPGDTTGELCTRLFGTPRPAFLACGGAPVSRRVLAALAERGLPVYEGYGLSENTSVVAWNDPAHPRAGSVGRPLDHVRVRIAGDGEILVASTSLFDGYTRTDPSACRVVDGWLHTGDLGELDDDGYLYIRGRTKNIVITAAGRNIAADWVAARYREVPGVMAAVVFGEGLDAAVGFFVTEPGADFGRTRAAIAAFGERELSEVERVREAHLIAGADPRLAGLFTVTGRPVRDRIWHLITETA